MFWKYRVKRIFTEGYEGHLRDSGIRQKAAVYPSIADPTAYFFIATIHHLNINAGILIMKIAGYLGQPVDRYT